MPAPKSITKPTRGARASRSKTKAAGTLAPRLHHALAALAEQGLAGARTAKLSVRVSPALVEAAKARSGIRNDSELLTAALAMVAAGDEFGPWLLQQAGRLPESFEIDF